MKKLGKLLPSVSLILFITTFILVVLTSHAFAKYYKIADMGEKGARPAMYEFVVTSDNNPSIYVDFGMDAETSPIYGTRKLVRNYDFSVRTEQSEVASMLTMKLFLPSKLYAKISQEDKTVPGLWVSWRMCVVNDLGLQTETLEDITDLGSITASGEDAIWTYSGIVQANSNPFDKQGHTDFRIEFEISNVEDTSSVKNAFIYISNMNLSIKAEQID